MATTPTAPAPGPPSLISREVIEIYNQLVESGRWSTDEDSTNPPEFMKSLQEIRELLTNEKLSLIYKTEFKIESNSFTPLKNLISSPLTAPSSSRKTLKRNSSRKSTFKHSKKH
jgi:hypothetical protein